MLSRAKAAPIAEPGLLLLLGRANLLLICAIRFVSCRGCAGEYHKDAPCGRPERRGFPGAARGEAAMRDCVGDAR